MSIDLKDATAFALENLVKNGEIGEAVVINRSASQLKAEIDSLWYYVNKAGAGDNILAGTSLVDDGVNAGDANAPYVVHSVDQLHNEVFDAGTW